MDTPNCHDCTHRRAIPGDAHSRCNNPHVRVRGNPHGVRYGWFDWPWNFDPIWLEACNGFEAKRAADSLQSEGEFRDAQGSGRGE